MRFAALADDRGEVRHGIQLAVRIPGVQDGKGALPKGAVDVRDRKDKKIGNFDGVIFDPEAGRVRYLVVDAPRLFGHRRYLLPIDPTQVDVERHALRVDVDGNDVGRFMNFDARAFPDFSDDEPGEMIDPSSFYPVVSGSSAKSQTSVLRSMEARRGPTPRNR